MDSSDSHFLFFGFLLETSRDRLEVEDMGANNSLHGLVVEDRRLVRLWTPMGVSEVMRSRTESGLGDWNAPGESSL